MDAYLERLTTMLVSFLYFWTSQRTLTLLTTKYYSHDLSVATVSKVMPWPGCVHISQIGSNTSGWRMIVLLSTSWPVVSHRDLRWDQFCITMYTAPIAGVIKRNGMGYHLYADDTQLYMFFNPADALQSRPGLLEVWLALTSVKYHGNV